MKLGIKIILSFVCISMLIASVGIVSHLYSNSIQDQLITNNIETTKLVQITADIERGLYQSLIYLNTINESEAVTGAETTFDEPSISVLTQQFYSELARTKARFDTVVTFIENNFNVSDEEENEEARIFSERLQFYESLSGEWLMLVEENSDQSDALFYTSINPYFRNRIVPVISLLRERMIAKQDLENEVLRQKLVQANYGIAVVSFIAVLLSLLIAFYVYRSIANPLMKLNESAMRLGQGDLDERTEIKNKDEIGELAASFNEMASNLKKRTLARDYLDNIIESIQETLIVTDENGIVVGVNQAGINMLHYKKEEIIGSPVEKFFDPDEMGETYESKVAQANIFEFTILTQRKRKIPVLFSRAELFNSSSEKVGAVYVATDITERKEADQKMRESLREKEILLSEIHHRVKNNLAVISGILQLQSYHTESNDVNKALKESQARIQSMSLVHEMLYQSETMPLIEYQSYVGDLLQAVSTMQLNDNADMNITADVSDIKMDLNQAIPCSLLVNEIIVNAYERANGSEKDGFIKLNMKESGDKLELVVEDNGDPISEADSGAEESFANTLIKTLTKQLKGEYEIATLKDGKGNRIKVTFPKELSV